ncbi:MAG: hypothetical protein NUW37_13185 [Planctomycetes bacterium]|nr:hypothetical protein [Planctomycetota bacterium]
MKLLIPEEARYTCQGTGRCCGGRWLILISKEERDRLGEVPWRDNHPQLPEKLFDEIRTPQGEVAHTFARTKEHKCVFLTGDGKCTMHLEHGLDEKATVCQSFPYTFFEGAKGVYVGLSFACPTVGKRIGEPLETNREYLGRLYQRVKNANGLIGIARDMSLAGDADLISKARLEELDDRLLGILEDETLKVPERFYLALAFLREMETYELGVTDDRDFRETSEMSIAKERDVMNANRPPVAKLNFRERLYLRALWFALLNTPSAQEFFSQGIKKAFTRLRHGLQGIVASLGFVRSAVNEKYFSFGNASKVKFSPENKDAVDALMYFVRMKVRSRQFRAYPADYIPCFNFLLFAVALLIFTSKAYAAIDGRGVVERKDVLEATVLIDEGYTHLPNPKMLLDRVTIIRTNSCLRFLLHELKEF